MFAAEKQLNMKLYVRKKRTLIRQQQIEAAGGAVASVKLQQEIKELVMSLSKAGIGIEQIDVGDEN